VNPAFGLGYGAAGACPNMGAPASSQGLSLGQLSSGLYASHHIAGFLTHRAPPLAAGRLDQALGLAAAQVWQAAGEHEGAAGQEKPWSSWACCCCSLPGALIRSGSDWVCLHRRSCLLRRDQQHFQNALALD